MCQLVIDIAGELSARRGEAFEDYTEAVRNLEGDPAKDGAECRMRGWRPAFAGTSFAGMTDGIVAPCEEIREP